MKAYDLVYVNNNVMGHFVDNVYVSYSNDERKEILKSIENDVKRKDSNRKMTSMIVGIALAISAIVIAILMMCKVMSLGEGQWFNYTFLVAGLFLMWVILYYLIGFIFYRPIKINIYFKSHKANNINSCERFASSRYASWMDKYMAYLRKTNFVIDKGSQKKDVLIPFGIKAPSKLKNLIFNGSIKANIPYFYLSYKNQKYLFLPGMIVLVDGKNSKVIEVNDFKVEVNDNIYTLKNKEETLLSFTCKGEFNSNFFYFKFEQL